MNTAQVSIELVLAGILALCAFVLPFWRGADLSQNLLQADMFVALLGIAYLFGVVFDKLADLMLSPMEHYLRLQEASRYLDDNPDFTGKDPFPQDKFEVRLRAAQDGRLDWMNSLRSRIRTSREVAVLGLPASLGIVAYGELARACPTNDGATCPANWMYAFIVLNILFFLAAILREEFSSRKTDRSKQPSTVTNLNVPKEKTTAEIPETSSQNQPLSAARKRMKTHELSRSESVREGEMKQASRQMRAEAMPYSLIVVNSAIALASAAALGPDRSWILLFGAGTLMFSLLALWAWYRITRTYIRFLARAGRERSKETHAS